MAKKKSSFRGKIAAHAKKEQTGGASYGYLNLPRGVPVYIAEPGGRAVFDIMPYTVTDPKHPDRDDVLRSAMPGDLWYRRPFKIHRNIGASNEAVVCLTSVNKRCPICDYRAQQIKKKVDKEITDALKTSLRNLYVIIPKEDKKREEIPHIWDISYFLFQSLLKGELAENEKYEIFPDLEEGLTLRVRFDSSSIGGGKVFAEASRIDFEPRKKPYKEDILDDIPNLDEVLQILTPLQLEQKFFEMEESDDVPDPVSDNDDDDDDADDDDADADDVDDNEDDATNEKSEKDKDADSNACIACEGSGKDSKGRTCRICRGTGEKPAKKKQDDNNKCPHGHKFGVDTEEYDVCFDCDWWDDCMDEKEKNE